MTNSGHVHQPLITLTSYVAIKLDKKITLTFKVMVHIAIESLDWDTHSQSALIVSMSHRKKSDTSKRFYIISCLDLFNTKTITWSFKYGVTVVVMSS